MKDFAPHTLFAIAQEAFGAWLYAGMIALAALLALYAWLALTRARFAGAPRAAALGVGVLAAIAALALAPAFTDARHAHLVATIDLVAMALVATGAFVGGFLVSWPLLAAARAAFGGREARAARPDERASLTGLGGRPR